MIVVLNLVLFPKTKECMAHIDFKKERVLKWRKAKVGGAVPAVRYVTEDTYYLSSASSGVCSGCAAPFKITTSDKTKIHLSTTYYSSLQFHAKGVVE